MHLNISRAKQTICLHTLIVSWSQRHLQLYWTLMELFRITNNIIRECPLGKQSQCVIVRVWYWLSFTNELFCLRANRNSSQRFKAVGPWRIFLKSSFCLVILAAVAREEGVFGQSPASDFIAHLHKSHRLQTYYRRYPRYGFLSMGLLANAFAYFLSAICFMLQASPVTSQRQTKAMLLMQGYWREFQKAEVVANFCTYSPYSK